jgi:hypothetical protein
MTGDDAEGHRYKGWEDMTGEEAEGRLMRRGIDLEVDDTAANLLRAATDKGRARLRAPPRRCRGPGARLEDQVLIRVAKKNPAQAGSSAGR